MNKDIRALRRAILSTVRTNQGVAANVITARTREQLGESAPAIGEVRKQIESLIDSGSIVVKEEVRGERTFRNLYLPDPLNYKGQRVTLRDLVEHKDNVHGFTLRAIQKRLVSGMSVEESLAVPKATKCKLEQTVASYRKEEDECPGFW